VTREDDSPAIPLDVEAALRSLAHGDALIEQAGGHEAHPHIPKPDARTGALLQLGALVAIGGSAAAFQRVVTDLTIAGIADDEIVAAVIALVPFVGRARIISAAPLVALALGYDVRLPYREPW
jgi:hypothetical protein